MLEKLCINEEKSLIGSAPGYNFYRNRIEFQSITTCWLLCTVFVCSREHFMKIKCSGKNLGKYVCQNISTRFREWFHINVFFFSWLFLLILKYMSSQVHSNYLNLVDRMSLLNHLNSNINQKNSFSYVYFQSKAYKV